MFGEIYLDSEGTSDMPSDQKAFKSTMYLVGPPLQYPSIYKENYPATGNQGTRF